MRRLKDHFTSVALGLVGQEESQPTGSNVQDGPIEAGLLPDIMSGLLDGPLGRGRHILHPEVFQHDNAVVLGVVLGDDMGEVFTLTAELLVDLSQTGAGFLAVLRSFLLFRELTLTLGNARLCGIAETWIGDLDAVGVGDSYGDPEVQGNGAAVRWGGVGSLDLAVDGHVPLGAVALDRGAGPSALQRPIYRNR